MNIIIWVLNKYFVAIPLNRPEMCVWGGVGSSWGGGGSSQDVVNKNSWGTEIYGESGKIPM